MITLRNWKIDDAFVFHHLSMDPYFQKRRLKQYLYPDTFLNTVTILETYQHADDNKFCIRAITSEAKVCGYIQFEKKDDRCGEISYWIGHEYWNQGIASQAVGELSRQVFQKFNILYIYARVKEDNVASQKVLSHNKYTCFEHCDDVLLYRLYK